MDRLTIHVKEEFESKYIRSFQLLFATRNDDLTVALAYDFFGLTYCCEWFESRTIAELLAMMILF